ncbi:hypothetical protein DXD68_15290 [Parabacteroides sp. TM07-1AC]|uniref:hypothetical protein n=1 Tax=Parabacteroides sp. TM07-1AC TaxID=2292363 RepID=UPI000EFE5C51|nr:hypothetical protein [Parabacteroides sp. TM07-1AC]RHU25298.1 hypothetical protein DXD68_15290 [Parabacteroides sp. TM07-1AC]
MKQIIQKYRLWLLCLMGAMMLLPDRAWGQQVFGNWVYGQDGTFSCTIDGGTVTINSTRHTEETFDTDGNLIQRYEGTISHIQLNSGTLILNGILQLASVTATGGIIQIQNPQTNYFNPTISKLAVNGNVEITRQGEIFCDYLSDDMVISGGNVTLSNLTISPNKTILMEGGTVTMKSVSYSHSLDKETVSCAILQTGGELTFRNCNFRPINSLESYYPKNIVQTEGGTCNLNKDAGTLEAGGFNVTKSGTLKISGGTFGKTFSGLVPFPFHVSEGGSLIIDDGVFLGSIPVEGSELTINGGTFYGLQSKNGKITINGGNFNATDYSISGQKINKPIIIEGGNLTITGGEFTAAEHESVRAAIQILADAEVELSGGVYNNCAFHIDPSVGLTPESMLEKGYGYFTLTQELQPDVQYKNDAIQKYDRIQVKALDSESPADYGREEALKADVGPNGKDVTVFGTQIPYNYEINTPEGLLWLMTAINGYWNKDFEVELPQTDYYKINQASEIQITADLDMAGYEWVPIFVFSAALLDGQNHRIYNLKVNQTCATFMQQLGSSSRPASTLANLVVNGTFNSKDTKYNSRINSGSSGLVCNNTNGYIVNCGVEQSKLTSNFTDPSVVSSAGLVVFNDKVIQNCYFTGEISMKETYTKPSWDGSNNVGGIIRAGEIAVNCRSGACIENTYSHLFKPVFHEEKCTSPELTITKDPLIGELVAEPGDGTIDGFRATDSKDALDALNNGVEAHKSLQGEIPWKYWVCKDERNDGFPILGEKNKPSVIEFPLTLKAEGPGTFEGYYLTGEEEEQEKHDFQADTTIIFTNARTFHVTPKPGKGATLVDVVKVVKKLEEGVEKLDSIPQVEIKTNEEYKFLAQGSIELVARFRLDTLYIENDTTVLGGSDEITSVDRVEISASGSEENKPAVVEIGNVTVQSKEDGGDGETPEGKTTITEDANVILKLSGTNDLGTLTNNGCVTIEKGDNAAEVSLAAKVINTGTLIDNTGLITEVLGEDEIPLLSVLKEEEADKNITSGEIASLSAKATVPADATVTFQWQRGSAGTWTDIGESTTCPEQIPVVMRAMTLDAEPEAVSYTNNYSEALNAPGTYEYRCLIKREVIGEKPVSTTLSVYGTVTVEPKTEPEPDPTPDPVPDPTPTVDSYTITLPSVVGATTDPVAGDYTVEEGSSFSFTLTLDSEYSQSAPVVKAGNETLQSDADGRYTLADVSCDLTISITGITPDHPTSNVNVDMPVRVWSHKGVLRLYSETKVVARIITFDGHLHKTLTVLGHVTETDLPKGVYFVLIKREVFKLMN